ncbi:response regulator [Niveispirillum sp. BGYR6]|uniref:response regulator n=1 Tax=Niveispirillum sp. BGYR6 TaxID=2971249 RepID=UPI0022B9C4D6|nr:response regulator [Niveispirillum sp. BGYR6]MDG5496564.1 response regulator [Niveispirillum sp. BGYR6]
MILIIDDVPEVRMLLGHMLRAGNLSVLEAASAEEAYRILDVERRNGPPPLVSAILMDVELPGQDGIEAVCLIKSNPRLAEIPVIVVSGREDEACLVNAFMAGAIDYVTKPVTQVQLLTRVRGALRLALESERRREREAALAAANAALRRDKPSLTGIDPGTGLPDLSALPALLSGRLAADLWLFSGEIDGWTNLSVAAGETGAALVKRQVLTLLGAVPGRVGDQMLVLPDGAFALLARRPTAKEALLLADTLCRAIYDATIPHPRSSGWPCITLSIGCARGDGLEARAQAAREQAKLDGGNRAVADDVPSAGMM